MKHVLVVVSALAIGLLPIAANAQAQPPRIIVSGEGTVTAAPDMANVSIGVVARETTAQLAMDGIAAAGQSLIAALSARGIEPRDIQTQGVSLFPLTQGGETPQAQPVITGYEASTTVDVRVRDLDALGALLDEMVSSGANSLQGLSFDINEKGPLMDEARRAAVQDALARARVLAEAAGVTLGPIQSITDAGGSPRPDMMRSMEFKAAADMPIAQGEVGVTAHVTMEIALEQ
jgi:uncharacterized protein YggE